MGRIDEARTTMSRLNGVDAYSQLVNDEVQEIEEKLDEERKAGKAKWRTCFLSKTPIYDTENLQMRSSLVLAWPTAQSSAWFSKQASN